MSTSSFARFGVLSLRQAAPILFVFLWATGFLVAKFGLPYAQPFTILTVRFALAGLMMTAIALLWRAPWPRSVRELLHLAVVGVLLQALYLGGCYAAIAAGMPAGITALVAGLQPVLTAALAGPLLGERLRAGQWLGIVLGFFGLLLVVWPKLAFDAARFSALTWAFASLFGITASTLYQKRYLPRADLRSGAAVQYGAALLATLPLVGFQGWGRIVWSKEFIFCLFWIVIVLSGLSIALLTWMMQRGAASQVAGLFYLTPPVAALGGYFWFGETLATGSFIGMAVAALGLYLVNRS